MTHRPPDRPLGPRLPWLLLAAMTLASFGGPVVIYLFLRGGAQSRWPPDRPVEWIAFGGVCALVVALMVLAVAVGVANQRSAARLRAARQDGSEPDPPPR